MKTREHSLTDSVQYLKGVGPRRAEQLARLGLKTVEDCLYFFPHRYEDRSRMRAIAEIVPGETVTLSGRVALSGPRRIGRRRSIFHLVVEDGSASLLATWFHCNEKYMRDKFPVGATVILSGKADHSRSGGGRLEIVHPSIEKIEGGDAPGQPALETGRIVPVYHATEGVHLKTLRRIMHGMLETHLPHIGEVLPETLRRRYHFPPRREAFLATHFPPAGLDEADLNRFRTPAQQSLIFEELLVLQAGLAYRKKHYGDALTSRPFKTRGKLIRDFVKLLRFELTGAQKRVLGEIMSDLEQDRPMHRLLHGDVGSGKTIVALTCLLTAVDNGTQGALMAPTELLAEQHYLNLLPYCRKLGVALELLTSASPSAEKKRIRQEGENGKTMIVVGTHALVQKETSLPALGLAVIDEQHRFGVLQRQEMTRKGNSPHILVMTATPIPRSLAMVLYGDMDVSLLDELPGGRRPIVTRGYFNSRRHEAYELLGHQLDQGRQGYIVCPVIEESETLDLKNALAVHEELQKELFPKRRVGLIHGRLKKEERQNLMAEFKEGKIDILVATTVIEVGIDVANATVMIVEHAERFGLAQLHQLRGRVGRGAHASHCLLVAYHPLSPEGERRLEAMVRTSDGFKIAEEDLALRGPGDVMGTRQSGLPELKIADLVRDLKLIETARKEAFALVDADPMLAHPENSGVRNAIRHRLGHRLNLVNVL